MLPISVDLSQIRVVLIGNGAAACRRLALLDEGGAAALEVYSPDPDPQLALAAGARLCLRLPAVAEVARAQLVFVSGLDRHAAAEVSNVAKAAGVLVNVEDDRAKSDFHAAAVIRRGDLTVAISTNGKSPGLAALMRQVLERLIGPEWGWRLDELAALRRAWRAGGESPGAVARHTREWAEHTGWLRPAAAEASQEPA